MEIPIFLIILVISSSTSENPSDDQTPISFAGKKAFPGLFPYVVHVACHVEGRHAIWCSGSILTDSWILTAAHCFPSGTQRPTAVILAGSEQVDPGIIEGPQYQQRTSQQVVFHPKYNQNDETFNVALISLNKPLRFTKFVQPIPLAVDKEIHPRHRENCIVVGYCTAEKGIRILSWQDIRISNMQQCHRFNVHEEHAFCSAVDIGYESCFGHSGGPVVCGDAQIGLVNRIGLRHKDADKRESNYVYGSIGYYEGWLRENIPDLPTGNKLALDKPYIITLAIYHLFCFLLCSVTYVLCVSSVIRKSLNISDR